MASKGLSVKVEVEKDALKEAIKAKYKPIARAAQDTIENAANKVKTRGRADIAAAGFSTRWQNALRVDVFPKKPKESANAAAFIHHNIQYAGIFETGGTIRGKPFLWLPLDTAPKRIGRQRITPALYQQNIGKLVPMKARGGRPPMLGTKVRLPASKAKQQRPKVTRAQLTRGTKGGKGVIRTIPLFFARREVSLRKRFHILNIINAARSALASFFASRLKDD